MRMSTRRKLTVLLVTLVLAWLAGDRVSNASRYVVPNPILVLTGQEAYQAGFDAHLVKPADPGALERILAAAGVRKIG